MNIEVKAGGRVGPGAAPGHDPREAVVAMAEPRNKKHKDGCRGEHHPPKGGIETKNAFRLKFLIQTRQCP
jgi:hypothetical protein